MCSSCDAFVVEVAFMPPALCLKPAFQLVSIGEGAPAFRGANVEPYARAVLKAAVIDVADDTFMVPPDRGGEHGEAAEEVGVFQAKVESREAAKRRSAHAGIFPAVQSAIVGIDKRHQIFGDEPAVFVGLASTHFPVGDVGIFLQTVVAGVGNADDNERGDLSGFDCGIGSFGDAPGASWDK